MKWVVMLSPLVMPGCGHAPPPEPLAGVPPGEPPGRSVRPYQGTPEYMTPQGRIPTGPIGRWSDEVPVVGSAGAPRADLLSQIRVELARIDEAAVALDREGSEPAQADAADPLRELREGAEALAPLVRARPDLAAEVDELRDIARRFPSMSRHDRGVVLGRVGELTDLIRIQLAATT